MAHTCLGGRDRRLQSEYIRQQNLEINKNKDFFFQDRISMPGGGGAWL